MHDMAQPFFVWARHERLPIARGYLFGSDPHECFVGVTSLKMIKMVSFRAIPFPHRCQVVTRRL